VESRLGVALVPSAEARHATRHVVFKPLADVSLAVDVGIALAYDASAETPIARRFSEVVTGR